VLIFFAVSGFLVARSWVGDPRLLPFALKRALRLMPGLAVVLLLTALVLGPLVTAYPLPAVLVTPHDQGIHPR
jgi:peptidoglycan/LPS O-acetylase OafA/YrhL